MKHISVDQSKCFGCKTCEIICSFTKEKEINPAKARIRIEQRDDGKVVSHVCQKCKTPVCVSSCPIHAIEIIDGKFTLTKPCLENCSVCVEACPYGAIVYLREKTTVDACDCCGACIPFCPAHAITLIERGDVSA
jgi:carbon-monoxide dehydrogenase iron sulfur subunit